MLVINLTNTRNLKMNNVDRYDFIVDTATDETQCKNNRERIRFHYFNKNGLVERKRLNDAIIRDLVDSNVVPSGWHIAYGSLCDYRVNRVIKLAVMCRVSSTDRRVAIEMLQEHCETQEAQIAEVA